MIYLHENGVTVVATDEAKRGKVYELNGEEYYVARGVADIKRIVDSGKYPLNRVITSKLTSLNYLFQIRAGYGQNAVPKNFNDDISNWDTSNVTEMKEVFSGWPKFNGDISNWDTSKVKSMHGMFKTSKKVGNYYMGPSSFNGPIGNWDVSNVVDMSEMFLGATSFNQDISNWDVSNVEDMNFMFSGATSFNQPLGSWDVSNVKDMSNMFCNITSIGIVAFVGTYEHDYADSTSFNQDISNWDVSNVENMYSMFSGATSFNQPLGNWNVSNVSTMYNMFSGAISFNQDISKWNVSNVANMGAILSGATSFNQPLGSWNVSNVNDMANMFLRATSFNQDISNWDVSNVNDMYGMFSGATSFNQDISKWNVSNVANMDHMFSNATSFNQDLNGWNAVSSVVGMFYGATSFNSPIGKWKLTAVTDMENMFRGATSFNQDISSWDVSNVIQMKGLFQDATSFNQDLRSWKLNEKLPKSRTMFTGATAFNKEHSPFSNIKTKKRVNLTTQAAQSLGIELTSEDKKTISKIKKLLKASDLDQVDLGVELLRSLDNKEVYETLLFDCKIIQEKLERNKMFTGTKAAQPFLDYALLNLIADVPKDAKVDDSINKKNITFLDLELFNLDFGYYTKIKRFLSLNNFFNLETLVIDLSKFSIKTVKDPGVDLDQVFNNNKISNLKVKNVSGDLNWLKNFQHLKKLDINFVSEVEDKDIDNFKYLKNLEDLTFKSNKDKNLDFLGQCKKIKNFNLSVVSDYYSDSTELKNINFLVSLPELEYFHFHIKEGPWSKMDKSGLNNCKKLKHLSIPIAANDDLSYLKKCKSLESLNSTNSSNFDFSARIYEFNGLKKLKNLKKLSIGSFGFFGIGNGNLMSDAKPVKSNLDNRISSSAIKWVDNVMKYNAIPFTGTVINSINSCEYEVVDGLRNGIYRMFYNTGKVKLEALYKKGKLSKIAGFYNGKGENILGNKGAVLGFDLSSLDVHRIGGNSGGFVKNGKPYNGFCYIELEKSDSYSWRRNSGGWDKKDLYTILKNIIDNESFDFENQVYHQNNLLTEVEDKISIVLKIKQGIISNTIFLARSEHFAKITVADNYNFDRFPFSDEDKSQFMEIDNEKHHRLEIYFHPMSELNICIDGEKAIEIDEEVSPMLKAHIDSVKKSLEEEGKTEVRSLPIWDYIIDTIDTSAPQTLSSQPDTKSQKNLERPKLSSEDRKAFSIIKKQLTSRDYDKIDQAISKLVSLNLDELFETLLDGCRIDNGSIYGKRNKFFTGSNPAQPFLDYALFCLIANAPEGADIHESMKNEKINKLDVNIFQLSGSYKSEKGGLSDRFIPIDNLTSLNDLTIDFKIFECYNDGPKNSDRSGWFKKSNITKLNAKVSGSLEFFKNLGQLTYLNLSFTYAADSWNNKYDFKPLESLENLEELIINAEHFTGLTSIDFIKNNKKLKKLSIAEEKYSWEYSGPGIENLDVIKNCNQLEELVLSKIKSTDLKGLLSCKNLKKLSLSFVEPEEDSAWTGFDFSLLKNCNSLEELDISDLSTDSKGLLSCKNLKTLSISFNRYENSQIGFDFSILKNCNSLEELDISNLSRNSKGLLSCKNLKTLSLSFAGEDSDNTEFDFSILKNCNSLESLNITGVESYNIEIKIVDFNSLNGLKNLKNIKIGDVNLNNSKSVFIN